MHPCAARIENEYRRRTPRSAAHHAQAQALMPGGDTRTSAFFQPYPLVIQRGEGRFLYDADGHRLLDFMNNATSLIHGHAFPPVVEAVQRQLGQGTAWGGPNEHQLALAAWLCARVASVDRIRFANSGTEATLMAIRAARAFTGRDVIVKMEGGYHGTHEAVSVSVFPDPARAGPAGAPAARPEGPGIPAGAYAPTWVVPFNDVEAVTARLESAADRIAAVVAEPLLASQGMVAAAPGYLRALRRVTEACGALLILDEVQTFRLDAGGAQALYDVRPDLTAFAKIIGGGLPVGAFGGRADIMRQFAPEASPAIGHGGTFNGNPLTMAAGRAAMAHLTPARIDRINALGDRLRTGLQEIFVEQGVRGRAAGRGSLVGFHFSAQPVRAYREARQAPALLSRSLFLACLNRGLFLSPAASLNVSTVMEPADIDTALQIFQDALVAMRPWLEREGRQFLL